MTFILQRKFLYYSPYIMMYVVLRFIIEFVIMEFVIMETGNRFFHLNEGLVKLYYVENYIFR